MMQRHSGAPETPTAPVLEINGARATIRLNRTGCSPRISTRY